MQDSDERFKKRKKDAYENFYVLAHRVEKKNKDMI